MQHRRSANAPNQAFQCRPCLITSQCIRSRRRYAHAITQVLHETTFHLYNEPRKQNSRNVNRNSVIAEKGNRLVAGPNGFSLDYGFCSRFFLRLGSYISQWDLQGTARDYLSRGLCSVVQVVDKWPMSSLMRVLRLSEVTTFILNGTNGG